MVITSASQAFKRLGQRNGKAAPKVEPLPPHLLAHSLTWKNSNSSPALSIQQDGRLAKLEQPRGATGGLLHAVGTLLADEGVQVVILRVQCARHPHNKSGLLVGICSERYAAWGVNPISGELRASPNFMQYECSLAKGQSPPQMPAEKSRYEVG